MWLWAAACSAHSEAYITKPSGCRRHASDSGSCCQCYSEQSGGGLVCWSTVSSCHHGCFTDWSVFLHTSPSSRRPSAELLRAVQAQLGQVLWLWVEWRCCLSGCLQDCQTEPLVWRRGSWITAVQLTDARWSRCQVPTVTVAQSDCKLFEFKIQEFRIGFETLEATRMQPTPYT